MYWKFLVLFVLWIALSGHYSPFFLISGALSVLATLLVSKRMLSFIPQEGYKAFPASTKGLLVLTKNFAKYIAWLACQILSSTAYVTSKIFFRAISGNAVSPQVKEIKMSQNSGLGAFMLTGSITITPGTVGMSATSDGKVKVLALDSELLSGVSSTDGKITEIFQK